MAVIIMDDRMFDYECPKCEYDNLDMGQSFCSGCGEPFEWKEAEE